jgi:hypothetical protein
MEQIGNKLRETDLRGRRLLAATCGRCSHTLLRDVLFQVGRVAEQVDQLDRRLVCGQCGNRDGNRLELADQKPRVPRGA